MKKAYITISDCPDLKVCEDRTAHIDKVPFEISCPIYDAVKSWLEQKPYSHYTSEDFTCEKHPTGFEIKHIYAPNRNNGKGNGLVFVSMHYYSPASHCNCTALVGGRKEAQIAKDLEKIMTAAKKKFLEKSK